jgi:nitrogen fixation protein NifB
MKSSGKFRKSRRWDGVIFEKDVIFMVKNRSNHPCFNAAARHQYGRLHLPVAPKCNVQCIFCNRKYDCVNESRPGVTSKLLSPWQALRYVEQYLKVNPQISTIGIAGPGDPLANPVETLQTIRLVREKFPELNFCLASNGLNFAPYIAELAGLGVTHATVTINAVDPEIGARIYAWVREGKVIYRGQDGAALLLKRQLAAIMELKSYGITVKVNSIIIPGINEEHLSEVARKAGECGADIMNCIPLLPIDDSVLATLTVPAAETVAIVRQAAAEFIPQMIHCARCRADAAGLIGASLDQNSFNLLTQAANLPLNLERERSYIAVATLEGFLINQHLGAAVDLYIFKVTTAGRKELVAVRPTPKPGGGKERWRELCRIIADCHTLLVSGIGESPLKILTESGIRVIETEGMIDTVLDILMAGGVSTKKASVTKCGFSCQGDGLGCG